MSSLTHTPSQRAFVGKRNRMTAADARKIVMTGSLLLHQPASDVPDGSVTQLSLLDVVDPVDIEEAFMQRKTSSFYDISSSTSSPRKVSEFPADDVEVRIVAREQHTLDLPYKITPCSVVDPHIKDMVFSFTDSFALVQRRYQQFGSGDAYTRMVIERPIIVRNTSRPLFEADGVIRRQERIARSASVVAECESAAENISKRNSYTSTVSTGTINSMDGERETKLHWSQPDPIVPGVIQRLSFAQLDQLNDSKRSIGRQSNLVNLLPVQNESDVIEKRSSPSYPDDRSGQKLLVKVLKLTLEPYFEPIFGSIAIYDSKMKRKVTENFYFDVNSEPIRALIPALMKTAEPLGRCSQGCFNVNGPLSDLFLVIKLYKVLNATDVFDGSEPYSNPAKDEKTKEKLSHSAKDYCAKLGNYRSHIGFMLVDLQKVVCGADTLERSDIMTASTFNNVSQGEAPLACGESDIQSIVSADRISLGSTSTFKRMGSGTSAATVLNRVRTPLAKRKIFGSDDQSTQMSSISFEQPKSTQSDFCALANLQPLTLSLNSFFRLESDKCNDDDLYKFLADARKPGGKLTKLKTFPVSLQLQLSSSTGEELLRRLTPELLRVAPFAPESDAELTKDVQEFAGRGHYAVNTSYRNTLYVYPRSVNMSNRQGTARNISIKVEMMNGSEIAQRVVFPPNSGTLLDVSATTTVTYHSKTPHFDDEIKMKLPLEMDDGYHLLFTFYHISCKLGAKEEDFEYPIGYSWLPLFRNDKLETGEFSLPICLERPPQSYGYLTSQGALPNIKWLDGHKALFTVHVSAVSTIHSQDNNLETFFSAVSSLSSNDKKRPPIPESSLINAIQGVLKARPERMVSFLYNVLDKLLFLISQPPYSDTVSVVCFETLGQLVKICTMLLDSCLDSHGRSSILISYLHYFKIAMKESSPRSELCRSGSVDKQKPLSPESQKLFNIIEDVERSSSRKESLTDSALSRSANKTVHEEIADLWTRSGGQSRDMSFMNSWFFLELMMKSMAEYLSLTGRLYLVRRSRFGERFIKALDSLSAAIAAEVSCRVNKDVRQSSTLVNSWAFFLRDAFSIMDRTYVMGLVRDFNQALTMKISCSTEPLVTNLMMLKLDFLRIISSQEHFVILNLPFSQSVLTASISSSVTKDVHLPANIHSPGQINSASRSPSSASVGNRSTSTADSWSSLGSGELSLEFRRCHYLIGLALADLSAVLETSPSSLLHSRAIGLIRNLLATHEADSRLMDASVKARVAALYLPLVSIVLDAHSQIHDPYGKVSSHDKSRFSTEDTSSAPGVNPKVALAIAGVGGPPSPPNFPTDGKVSATSVKKTKLSLTLSRQVLCCVCWVLKNMDTTALRQWIRELPPQRLGQLLSILQLSISCFEYKISQAGSGSLTSIETEDVHSDRREGVRWRRGTPVKTTDVFRSSTILCDDEALLESSLSSEITLCVLDVVETIVRVISMPGCDHLHFSLPVVLRQIMHMLACNQSLNSLESIFATQRALIVKYPELVFEQEIEQCGELCLQLLRHCASKLPSVRSQAAASLYLLMRESFENGTNLSRVKMQITMSLSTLVSCGTRAGMWLNEDCLRRSLKTVLIYSENDINSDLHLRLNASFSEQVKDLVFNLHMILSDTVKMKEYANDFEMTLDLMYRVAKGYQNNPDLRLTWLLNMAARHSERGLHCEAAQCMLHSAALAAEYIAMTSTESCMPPGAVSFFPLSENILEESAVSDDVVSPETDGICESRHFTASGLVQLVEKTGTLLEKAQMYELLPDLYKVIEPIIREWRDYRRLSVIHGRLSEALAKVEPFVPIVEDTSDAWVSPLRSSDKRSFGTYFRVGFYGPGFGDLDGEEYIYKEPPFTKLSEISHRLESFYSDRFGRGSVEVIKDSNNVVRTSHDSNKVYLQVTYVEPFFDKWERKKRTTHFERNHVLKRFSYATPFTRDGRAHGDLKDQYKRRTILTTIHSFPYVKTRIRIVEKEQKVLQPIQVAIEDVEKKTRELSAAIHQSPPDAKMLQMVLQGCIGTTVNQGPVQVANVFLTDVSVDSRGRPVDKLQNKLRLAFRDFAKKCSDALSLNKQLIQPDQYAYQNELEKNYVEFQRQMAPILMSTKRESTMSTVSDLLISNECQSITVA